MAPLRTLLSLAIASVALFSSVSNAAPASAMTPIDARSKTHLKFPFHTRKVKGVNLGGWFVLEPWITPSIFEASGSKNVVDEYTFCKHLGAAEAHKRLSKHWATWITKADFHDIRSKGLNFVRIPIGYWSIHKRPEDPYVQGAYQVLGKAIDWAHEAGLNVMIDLHGAPLSQNGFDNSGRRGAINWQKGGSVDLTKRVLEKIKKDHGTHPAVAAIEIVNEPMGPVLNVGKLKQFYLKMNKILRGNGVAVTFHDAFLGVNSWNNFGRKLGSWLLDTHHYEVFDSGYLQMNLSQHLYAACSFGGQMSTNDKVTISGEWSGALTDCAKWLNGRGVGARYDGTYNYKGVSSYYIGSCKGLHKGKVSDMSAELKSATRQFIEAQMDAFEFAGGWIWWTWRTESAPEWDFRELANAGVMPQPLSAREYPDACSG